MPLSARGAASAICTVLHINCLCISMLAAVGVFAQTRQDTVRRPVTVDDCIQMQVSADALQGRPIAHHSPDGKKFVTTLRKGNLEQNTNEYTLLLWNTDELLHSPSPRAILSLSSSSNRPGIQDVKWLSDNETIAFLGEHPGELQQIYILNIRTRLLKKLTNHPTNLISYSINAQGDKIAYLAEKPAKNIWDDKSLKRGVIVSTQPLRQLLTGQDGGGGWFGGYLVFYSDRTSTSGPLATGGDIRDPLGSEPRLSPDGKYIIIATQLMGFQKSWNKYKVPELQKWLLADVAEGRSSWMKQFELIDTATGKSQVILNAPQTYGYEIAWLPDSRSAVLSGVYLPLEGTEGEERKARESAAFAVEIRIPSAEIIKVGPGELKVLDANMNQLSFEIQKRTENWKHGPRVLFRRNGNEWNEEPALLPQEDAKPEILLKQDMNNPPSIVALDPQTHRISLLLDLNPQFRKLKFGKEEQVKWKGTDGHEVNGGLYYPADYVAGNRYPLVIQTHWFTPDLFWIDGPWTTAFAAQPLAGKGIMVLQAPENFTDMNTPKEVQREVSTLEGAVDYLDKQGLIDRNRVGLIGFSRTCLFVKYALARSRYHFTAASVTDGIDGGYFQYILNANSCADCNLTSEGMNAGLPFGEGLSSWILTSPGFNIERVQTPLLITAINSASLLGEWEWFAALTRLRRPVELIYIRDGSHELQRPWDRAISQQRNVDWFDFWLNGKEDPDPAKGEQYARWRELRRLQVEDEKKSATPQPLSN